MTPPRDLHATCQHRKYLLTCDDFEHLCQRAEGRCEGCDTPPEDTGHGILYIDHDSRRGHWAVRGLLCTTCNTVLGDGTQTTAPHLLRYLAHPWVDERFGDAVIQKPEPPDGYGAGIPGRRGWVRCGDVWRGLGNHRGTDTASWDTLNWRLGPHRLVIVPPGSVRGRIRQIVDAEEKRRAQGKEIES